MEEHTVHVHKHTLNTDAMSHLAQDASAARILIKSFTHFGDATHSAWNRPAASFVPRLASTMQFSKQGLQPVTVKQCSFVSTLAKALHSLTS